MNFCLSRIIIIWNQKPLATLQTSAMKAPLEHRLLPYPLSFGAKCRAWVGEQVWLVPLVAPGLVEQLLQTYGCRRNTPHLGTHETLQLSRELLLRCLSPPS